MRCILHIGTEKTGSTAIQEYLYSHKVKLKGIGVHVCTSVGKGNNRALPAAFMSDLKVDDFIRSNKIEDLNTRHSWKSKLLKGFSAEVVKSRKNASVFVISSEHFHSRLQTPVEVRELCAFLATLFDEVEVICYLRRQDEMALSRYSEALRTGHVPASPLPRAVFKGKNNFLPPYFNFQSLMERWADAFGEDCIKPRVYSRAQLLNGDIVTDFLAAAGIDIAHSIDKKQEKKNIALSAEAQAILLGVNKKFREEGVAPAIPLRERLIEYLEQNAPGESRLPSASRAQEFYSFFEASNSMIARRWFNRETLFDTDFSQYPEKATIAATAKVAEILAGFLLLEKK